MILDRQTKSTVSEGKNKGRGNDATLSEQPNAHVPLYDSHCIGSTGLEKPFQ